VFELFDTIALLSRGRIIYMGKADEAASFFIQAPELQFSFEKYHNPSEFLHDVSGSLILNMKVHSTTYD
jgi:ABC-type multidrug transport system ATPase subunit